MSECDESLGAQGMAGHANLDESGVALWRKVVPPLWWPAAGRYIVADRHLPDGTRQHMVQGRVPPGTVVANAQLVGEEDVLSPRFDPAPSHLSGLD